MSEPKRIFVSLLQIEVNETGDQRSASEVLQYTLPGADFGAARRALLGAGFKQVSTTEEAIEAQREAERKGEGR